MPAILTHASTYPPRRWNLTLRPVKVSQDELWEEMTKDYELRMAARQVHASTTRSDTITEANLRMLRPEAMERVEKEASTTSKTSFEDESDISYVYLAMDVYEDSRVRVHKNRLQRIPEGRELQLEPRCTAMK